MRFWFQAWWRQDDGRTYSFRDGGGTLADAQKAHARVAERMTDANDTVVAAGLSRIECPPDGPWPRSGGQGREPVLVRAPETGSLEAV